MDNSKQPRYVLGIDPSGNYEKEGQGTTGWCVFDNKMDVVVKCGRIPASLFNGQMEYWNAHLFMINDMYKKYRDSGIVVSMESFVLYAHKAKSQYNSAMETSQLIGAIKIYCYLHSIPLYMRTASAVMQRWTDTILCNKNYIHRVNKNFYVDCKNTPTCEHERDAIRHAVHCATFELRKEKKQ